MRALLLSAGLGNRLRPLTDTVPKCLVPINGKPLMAYWLELLIRGGISSVLVNLHYLADQVQAFIDKSPYQKNVQTFFEEELLGTGGTLLANRTFFNDEPLMLIHADNLSFFDIGDFMESHASRPGFCDITMMTFETETPETCGIVELDKNGVVRAFHEKVESPPGNLANGAVYILEPGIFRFLKSLGAQKIDFSTEVLPQYIGRIYTFHNRQYHLDIGTTESYLKAQTDFSSSIR